MRYNAQSLLSGGNPFPSRVTLMLPICPTTPLLDRLQEWAHHFDRRMSWVAIRSAAAFIARLLLSRVWPESRKADQVEGDSFLAAAGGSRSHPGVTDFD